MEVFVVRELLVGQVVLAGLFGRNSHCRRVGEESEPLRVPAEQTNVVTVSHVRGVHPVQLQSPLVAGAVPVHLGQAVDCQENLEPGGGEGLADRWLTDGGAPLLSPLRHAGPADQQEGRQQEQHRSRKHGGSAPVQSSPVQWSSSSQVQGRKQTDENNPLFPPSFPLYCQSPFHSLSFHSSLTPTSAGFINTFSYGNKQSDKTSPSALLGPDRIFSCWTQCDQHFAHLYFLCCLFHLAWVDHAMD